MVYVALTVVKENTIYTYILMFEGDSYCISAVKIYYISFPAFSVSFHALNWLHYAIGWQLYSIYTYIFHLRHYFVMLLLPFPSFG